MSAVLYLKGRKEPMTIANERAKKLKDDWLSGNLPQRIDLGEAVIDARDIKGIEKIYEEKGVREYTQEELSEFQSDFFKWKEENCSLEDKPIAFVGWLVSLGFARWKAQTSKRMWYDHIITDKIMYNEYFRKFDLTR
jgi:hypothetical protein